MQDLQRKIDREKAFISALNQMRQVTNDAQVPRVESQIRDARRNLQYFEQTLTDLRARKMGTDLDNMSLSGPSAGSARGDPRTQRRPDGSAYTGSADYGAPGPGGYSGGGAPGLMPPRAPYAPPNPAADRTPRARPNYSKLGEKKSLAGGGKKDVD